MSHTIADLWAEGDVLLSWACNLSLWGHFCGSLAIVDGRFDNGSQTFVIFKIK